MVSAFYLLTKTEEGRMATHIRDQLIDALLKEYKTSEDLFGKEGLLKQLTKDLVERILQAEMTM